jgi:hypothetical protein
MLKRLPKVLIALALASSIGLHWAFLQAVAWTGMVISFSQDGPVTEAVAKTFDGHHLCSLCKQIEKDKRTEKKADCGFDFGKVKFPYARVVFLFNPPTLFWEILSADPVMSLRPCAPPVPPPRSLFS